MLRLTLLALLLMPSAVADSKLVPVTTKSEEARREYLAGRTYAENANAAGALPHYRKAVQLDPDFATAQLALSGVAPTTVEFNAALAQAVKSADKVSEGEKLTIQAAELANRGRNREAEALRRKVAEMYPGDPRANFAVGANYMGQQDFAAAANWFGKAIAADPNWAPPHNQRGYAYRFLREFDKSEKDFRRYVELLPNDPNPYDSLAEFLLTRGRFDESIVNYRKALSVDPGFVPSHLGIAADLTYQRKFDDARREIEAYLKAATNDGQRIFGHWQIAMISMHENQPQKAIAALEQAREINRRIGDKFAESFDVGNEAQIYTETGNYDAADKAWKDAESLLQAADIKPETREVNRMNITAARAALAVRRGQLAEAKSLTESFSKNATQRGNRPGVLVAHSLEGQIAAAEKRWNDAIEQYRAANQNDPYNLYRLAWALEQKGDRADALKMYQRVAAFNPLLAFNYAFVRDRASAAATKLASAPAGGGAAPSQ